MTKGVRGTPSTSTGVARQVDRHSPSYEGRRRGRWLCRPGAGAAGAAAAVATVRLVAARPSATQPSASRVEGIVGEWTLETRSVLLIYLRTL